MLYQNTIAFHILLFLASCSLKSALADWPQFLGPNRDGHATASGLLKTWPEGGPSVAWTFRNAGLGYSSPTVVGNRLLITGSRSDQEQLICLDASTGQELWSAIIGPKFDFQGNTWGAGPRAAPSVLPSAGSASENLVVALGGGGNLICANLSDGRIVWQKHMMQDLSGEVNPIGGGPGTKPGEPKIGWGYSWSPLADDGQLICFPGGSGGAVAALSPSTGEVLWRSKDFTAQASYASIVAVEIDSVRQYAVLHNEGLTGIDAKDGTVLWSWKKTYSDVVIPTPLVAGERHIYVSAGSSPSTCGLVQITRSGQQFQAEMQYPSKATRVMKNLVGGSVIVDGHAYGYSDKIGWVCQEVITGAQKWAARSPLKAGSVIAAEGLLYCYDEDRAEVALVEATPKEFSLRSSFGLPESTAMKAPSGRNWTPPVIANGTLFIRDQELLFAYDIRDKS
jgi:outer membrane protein assembly factor BamB